jgi:hypothetical protein
VNLTAFCESPIDFQMTRDLVDRVLANTAQWVADMVTDHPEAVRTWRPDGAGRDYFDLHCLVAYAKRLEIRLPQGHFDGQPALDSARMARNAFVIAAVLNEAGAAIDGVVLVSDLDAEPRARRAGLAQGRAFAERVMAFRVVIGAPNIAREAWVLVGFDPANDEEQRRLDELRTDLGFRPNHESHRLDSNDEGAKHSPKRVLRILTDADADREASCWRDTSLQTLHERGEHNGLRDFLVEIREHLVPLLR